MPYGMPEWFEWDPDKAQANLEKHGLSFEEAVSIFDGATYEVDVQRGDELRHKAIGMLGEMEVVVVYTVRGRAYRIISARRAKRRERQAYREHRAL